jgi:hypothetical protein
MIKCLGSKSGGLTTLACSVLVLSGLMGMAAAQTVQEFPPPIRGSGTWGITAGPDGATSAWHGFAAASAGSGLSAIAIVIGKTRADLSASEPIPLSVAKHVPTRLLRNSGGTESIGSNAAFSSANWSGYLAPSQSAGQPYTSAAGRWIVPPVSYITSRGISVDASSIWVGIGGLNGDQTLIQVGTEQDASATGATTYYAWYETLPANQISLSPQQYPVRPGDVVGASLQCTASCTAGAAQSWTLAMTDYTAGWSWTSPNIPYASSLGSAE